MRFYAKTKRIDDYKNVSLSSNTGLEIQLNAGNTPLDYTLKLIPLSPTDYQITLENLQGEVLYTGIGKSNYKKFVLCKHDWDCYGKCCICGKYNIQGIK